MTSIRQQQIRVQISILAALLAMVFYIYLLATNPGVASQYLIEFALFFGILSMVVATSSTNQLTIGQLFAQIQERKIVTSYFEKLLGLVSIVFLIAGLVHNFAR